MDQQTFTNLFRDLISRMYDKAAIENHPLAAKFQIPTDPRIHRADAIRQLILNEIENLRPEGSLELWQSPEWRPYLILSKRYIECLDPAEIAKSLFIGDRQFRRDHSRSLLALSTRIWNIYFAPAGDNELNDQTEADQQDFVHHPEHLVLQEVVEGVRNLISRRMESEKMQLIINLPDSPVDVYADRVGLRQVLLSLLNYVLHISASSEITMLAKVDQEIGLGLRFETDELSSSTRAEEQDTLEFIQKMSAELSARLVCDYPPATQSGSAEIWLFLESAKPKIVLMVDDQPATIKMFQRYLSGKSLEITGLNDPALALATARQLQPALILLDVMMPHIDGWEILQALKLDPGTKDIPIIVCSAWGEPELAQSLGAVEFIKKPVIQKDLLKALHQFGLIRD